MFKRLVLAAAVGLGTAAAALADDAPKSADECLKMSFDLAKSAEGKKLSEDQLGKLEQDIEQARAAGDSARVADIRAQLELSRARTRERDRLGMPLAKPCYFNTGCCSFSDGDVTGIEIADGRIKLVRWPDDSGNPRPKTLTSVLLSDVFKSL